MLWGRQVTGQSILDWDRAVLKSALRQTTFQKILNHGGEMQHE